MSEVVIEVPGPGNYYGSLSIMERDGKFFWSIENWDGEHWCEIPEYLYVAILRHVQENEE